MEKKRDATTSAPQETLARSLDAFIRDYRPLRADRARKLDREVRAAIATATRGMSPVELGIAYLDWLAHLSLSPGKIALLAQSFLRKSVQLGIYGS